MLDPSRSKPISIEVRANIISYNSAISSCERRWQKALLIMAGLRDRGVSADVITFNSSISFLTLKVLNVLNPLVNLSAIFSGRFGELWGPQMGICRMGSDWFHFQPQWFEESSGTLNCVLSGDSLNEMVDFPVSYLWWHSRPCQSILIILIHWIPLRPIKTHRIPIKQH